MPKYCVSINLIQFVDQKHLWSCDQKLVAEDSRIFNCYTRYKIGNQNPKTLLITETFAIKMCIHLKAYKFDFCVHGCEVL